ncbi:MAG: hypothetical protein ACI9PP_000439, partial [Halobacteriales archaeon]
LAGSYSTWSESMSSRSARGEKSIVRLFGFPPPSFGIENQNRDIPPFQVVGERKPHRRSRQG